MQGQSNQVNHPESRVQSNSQGQQSSGMQQSSINQPAMNMANSVHSNNPTNQAKIQSPQR